MAPPAGAAAQPLSAPSLGGAWQSSQGSGRPPGTGLSLPSGGPFPGPGPVPQGGAELPARPGRQCGRVSSLPHVVVDWPGGRNAVAAYAAWGMELKQSMGLRPRPSAAAPSPLPSKPASGVQSPDSVIQIDGVTHPGEVGQKQQRCRQAVGFESQEGDQDRQPEK